MYQEYLKMNRLYKATIKACKLQARVFNRPKREDSLEAKQDTITGKLLGYIKCRIDCCRLRIIDDIQAHRGRVKHTQSIKAIKRYRAKIRQHEKYMRDKYGEDYYKSLRELE